MFFFRLYQYRSLFGTNVYLLFSRFIDCIYTILLLFANVNSFYTIFLNFFEKKFYYIIYTKINLFFSRPHYIFTFYTFFQFNYILTEQVIYIFFLFTPSVLVRYWHPLSVFGIYSHFQFLHRNGNLEKCQIMEVLTEEVWERLPLFYY